MATDLSDEIKNVFEMVNFVCICSIVCMFGISANIINLFIFYKQGFKNPVNIGFFGLAISDVFCLMTLQWVSICLNPSFISSGVPWIPLEVMYLSGAWPHGCFSRITSFITAYITAERYLSIAYPLKVKHIITRKTATVIVCLIYFINIVSLIPEYSTCYLGWRVVPYRNGTLIGILFTSSRIHVDGIIYVIYSVLGITSFVAVILFTVLLVTKLRQSSQWRQEVTSNSSRNQAVSSREKKTVKMVVLIACVLIACYSPGAVVALAAFVVGPDFNIRGRYTNICEAMWSIALTCQSINSSVNIFVYYAMSSKYRQTVHAVILKKLINQENSKTNCN